MERKRPKIQNKIEIPVNIFKGEELIAECSTIKEAAKFLKKETEAKRFNWSAINNGIWFNKSFSYNSATYFFTTDETAVKRKMEKLKQKL